MKCVLRAFVSIAILCGALFCGGHLSGQTTRPNGTPYITNVTPLSGFVGNVSLSCAGAPSNTSCSISPAQLALSGATPAQATITVTASKKLNTGNYTLTLTGTSGTLAHSIPIGLTIN